MSITAFDLRFYIYDLTYSWNYSPFSQFFFTRWENKLIILVLQIDFPQKIVTKVIFFIETPKKPQSKKINV